MAREEIDPMEQEVIIAVSRGADTVDYVTSEFQWGKRRLARKALDRVLRKGNVLMTVEDKLILPPV